MKKIMLLFLFLSCVANAKAQQITFEKVIDTLGCRTASCVHQTFDGGYIACGVSFYNNNDAAVVKLDSNGNIQWVKIYGGGGMDGANRVEQLPDSTFIVSGVWDAGINGQNWFLKLDANGDTIWTSKIKVGTLKHTPEGMAQKLTNSFPITGYINVQGINLDAYLLIADSFGTLSIYKTYGDSLYGQEGKDITKTFDNGYAITGVDGISALISQVYLVRTNLVGDTLWEKSYTTGNTCYGQSICQTADSGFIIAANTQNNINLNYNGFVIKTKANGDTIWTKVIYNYLGNGLNCIQETKLNQYILTGSISDTIYGRLYLIKLDNNGDTLWTRGYAPNGYAIGYYLNETTDGGIVVCGTSGKFYIIKTDSNGYVNTYSGLNNYSQNDFINIFPNPCNGMFEITFENPNFSHEIKVTTSLGNMVFNSIVENGTTSFVIDLTSCIAGIYFVTVKCQAQKFTKKLVLIK